VSGEPPELVIVIDCEALVDLTVWEPNVRLRGDNDSSAGVWQCTEPVNCRISSNPKGEMNLSFMIISPYFAASSRNDE
jgi:hypothetical protein